VQFVADTMMGKLSRWLRILGYDTVYDSLLSLKQLTVTGNSKNAIFLTRRKIRSEDTHPKNHVYVQGEKFEAQLRFVIECFNLNITDGVFTRCLKCNEAVKEVEKIEIGEKVPERSDKGVKHFLNVPTVIEFFGVGHTRKIH